MAPSSMRTQRQALTRRWERFLSSEGTDEDGLRPEVAQSWRRSLELGVLGRDAAPADDLDEEWREGRLGHAVRVLENELSQVGDQGEVVVAVADAHSRLLWTASSPVVRRRAEEVNFVPGGRWDEASIGTNGIALAQRTGAPSMVWSCEHFNTAVQDFVCYATPIDDPLTGERLGVIDLTTAWTKAQPLGLPTTNALARLFRDVLASNAVPPPALRALEEVMEVRLLGRPELRMGARRVAVSPRQMEIVALLALYPDGLDGGELHAHLYGDEPVSRGTLKAEISHLRRQLGGRIASRPYRLLGPVRCDALEVLQAVRRGDVRAAAGDYRGELLPGTESPELLDWSRYLAAAVREGLAGNPDPDAVLTWSDHHPADITVLRAALSRLRPEDSRRALLAARLRALTVY
ncbi:transcriptional regulator [Longimycelium tulufanense]|uniref:Transcriptional regulator n=1 Tax=Longimycelium tulufanense TaxID=907463 RepID=A0A8J3C810_9PSEU|nr:transcriptional regulator [Longimycelium tulufanense]GGM38547.1 transcriptional regulator [Longimycelium tulufanense]